MLETGPVVVFEEVTKRFGEHVVLDRVSFSLPRGKTTCIIGPSGVGKTVVLKLIVGLLTPDSGRVIVDGKDISTLSRRQLYALRLQIGMLFQDAALFDSLTVFENVAFPLRYHTRDTEQQIAEKVEMKLKMVGLPGTGPMLPAELSGGMRKRVGLARALMLDPAVVLFDEPNSGLDPVMASTIDQLIMDTRKSLGISFLIISHDIVGTLTVADWIGLLHGGRLVEFCTAEDFRASPIAEVRTFLSRDLDFRS